MVNERTILAGFGGQGVMLMGQLLTQAGMIEGKEVSWLPSYGPEMRGGTANCGVIVQTEPISSPVVEGNATSEIMMNTPSLDKFEKDLVPGGKLLINSSLISKKASRDDVEAYYIPSSDIANELGDTRIANMVMLGAFVELTGAVEPESIFQALESRLGLARAHLMDINKQAFARGAACVKEQRN
ncbi:MAG TPA: 2-oxoacid:ferredoxin oxidoreductase subunit gamma [Tissierellia bacterium]|jgi:2-oxoglutarate ferredoxin oxidoreductase subunit gamma|nr:2-oxoacid:ferredoxin oxidoreductase subunit gamma [Tissierellia bacterium]